MFYRFGTRNSVAITGSVIGLSSLLFGWFTLKSSRIAAGVSLKLWESTDGIGTIIILVLWLVCLITSWKGNNKAQSIILGSTANLILVSLFCIAGLAANQILEGEIAFSRVSLSSGIWIALAGSYIVIYSSRQSLPMKAYWRHLISWSSPVIFLIFLFTGWFDNLSILQEFFGKELRFRQELIQHIILFGSSVTMGTILGILLGIWATRSKRAEKPIFFLVNITQTIPSLALFGILIAPLSALSFSFPVLRELGIRGVGFTPAIIALTIYSLLPIVRNTYVGLRQLDPSTINAGFGMGMSRLQVFRRIEIPLALPLVLEGVRTASVQSVGLTTVAALIGAGGLGWFIFQGLGQAAADLIMLGALPIIGLALATDSIMRAIIKLVTPKGLLKGAP